ncbi:MAG: hypothetical protein JO172_08230 [Hyphomicrobiales bacterium]|nr:hypothetical protein [Hyphomicrobiales bacterium]
MMAARAFLVLAAALLLGAGSGANAFPQQKVIAWIAELYTTQASRIADSRPLEESAVRVLFTPEVAELWQAAHRDREAAAPAERELDPFFGWRVPLGTKVSFAAVSQVLGTAEAPTLLIDVIVSGKPRRIVLDALDSEGSWRIANIAYDEGEDFISFERQRDRP